MAGGRRKIAIRGATRLVITADGGGSNGSRLRLWKVELQRLAEEIGIDIVVHHLPPGTSKWNKIEHRLFSFITMNWRAKPLLSYRVIVELIAATTTKTGLTVQCELDSAHYPKGIAVSDQADGHTQHHSRHVPRRVELHNPPYRNEYRASQSSYLRMRPKPQTGCRRSGPRNARQVP